MSVRTIVFDFGNVLGYFSPRRAAEQLAALARDRRVSPEEVIAFWIASELEPRFETGELSSRHILDLLRDQFDLEGSDEQVALAYADMFTPNEAVCNLVPLLAARHRLILLSNTNDLHYRHFRRQFASTLDRFHALVTSHEVGLRKPDARIYHHVEQLADGPASACLFIDDLPANVEAARSRGWQGIVYQQGCDLRQRLHQAGVAFAI